MLRQRSRNFIFWGFIVSFILLVGSCSTEKNTFINRTYHSITAKYNGYFNARLLIKQGLEQYRAQAKEDYNKILPLENMPDEEDAVQLYPAADTAIKKCTKVISKHSMPTASKPSRKNTEHANWIDQCWLLIGKANYIKRDYQKALKNFKYIHEFYLDRPSTFQGQLWMLKTYLKTGNSAEATRTLQKIKQRVLKKKRLKKSKDEEVKHNPPFPKHYKYHYARVKAMYYIANKNYKKAVENLKVALDLAKRRNKPRLAFIIGQILQKQGKSEASKYYTIAIKKNAPFIMMMHAKMNRTLVSNEGEQKMLKELQKMANEDMYFEFRDQIYYTMADLELKYDKRKQAKHFLSQSVFYSLDNNLQKGKSYEKLGDLWLEGENYVYAQKYYDSSAQVIPKSYKNADQIEERARKLKDLVINIETIRFQDSVQMIAKLNKNERKKFIKDVIKQLKKEAQERKEREARRAARLRKLQQLHAKLNAKPGKNFYFSNVKAMRTGVEDFRKIWGQRENKDYWRLSNKPSRILNQLLSQSSDGAAKKDTSIVGDSTAIATAMPSNSTNTEGWTVENLLKDIPLTDSAMATSNKKLLEALYKSGLIYEMQLKENDMAAHQFQRVLDKNVENKYNLPSAFQLYKINEKSGNPLPYKKYIIENYPHSDYANYMRDPNYFIKKRKRDKLAMQDYLTSVKRYQQGIYYPVIIKADQVIKNEPKNKYRKNYLLLKAMTMGEINNNKTSLLPVLNKLIKEYPNSEEATRAKELKDLIKNGVPAFKLPKEEKGSDLFKTLSSEKYFVILALKPDQRSNVSNKKISNFNQIYFRRLALHSRVQFYSDSLTLILVNPFKFSTGAADYIKDFENAKRTQYDFGDNTIVYISQENLKVVLQQLKWKEYVKFYNKNIKE